MTETTKKLLAFIEKSPTAFHAVDTVAGELRNAGYTELRETDAFLLAPGGKYFVIRGGSSIIAFRVPTVAPRGFMMCASHSDSPTFKIKEYTRKQKTKSK